MQERNFFVSHFAKFHSLSSLQIVLAICLVLATTFVACDNAIREKAFQTNAVARVNDSFLYHQDLMEIIPENTSHEDSVRMVQGYIEDWVSNMLNYYNALENLSEDQIDIESEIEKYRSSLISYIYERELVLQKLDTIIQQAEIDTFYANNFDNFKIKTELIKVNYIKLVKGEVDIKQFRKLIKKRNSGYNAPLHKFCNTNLVSFNLDDDFWMEIEDLEATLGVNVVNFMWALGHDRLVEANKDEMVLFVDLKEIRRKDNTTPLSAATDRIKGIILNQRRLKLINDMEHQVYLEAKAQKKFEIF
ncbi:MAG: hypothetical protein HRT71_04915 [Flavobacteriales bacterium]|nr:hypothetical protein [Flavobacteriales bacterium]